ncbi:MAG: hypothetical protein V1707_01595 [bacterium]
MKQFFIPLVITVLLLANPAGAVFWNRLSNPEQPVVEEKVDLKDLNNRWQTVLDIGSGKFKGKEVELKFTEGELRAVAAPYLAKELEKSPVKNIDGKLLDGEIEVWGDIEQPVKGKLLVRVAPFVEKGVVKLEIRKVRFGWWPVPVVAVKKVLGQGGVKLDKGFSTPNFTVTGIEVTKGLLVIRGEGQ